MSDAQKKVLQDACLENIGTPPQPIFHGRGLRFKKDQSLFHTVNNDDLLSTSTCEGKVLRDFVIGSHAGKEEEEFLSKPRALFVFSANSIPFLDVGKLSSAYAGEKEVLLPGGKMLTYALQNKEEKEYDYTINDYGKEKRVVRVKYEVHHYQVSKA